MASKKKPAKKKKPAVKPTKKKSVVRRTSKVPTGKRKPTAKSTQSKKKPNTGIKKTVVNAKGKRVDKKRSEAGKKAWVHWRTEGGKKTEPRQGAMRKVDWDAYQLALKDAKKAEETGTLDQLIQLVHDTTGLDRSELYTDLYFSPKEMGS